MAHDKHHEDMQQTPLIGDAFPRIEVTTTHGTKKIAEDDKGK